MTKNLNNKSSFIVKK